MPGVAETLGISPRTVDREWAFAREFLARALGDEGYYLKRLVAEAERAVHGQ